MITKQIQYTAQFKLNYKKRIRSNHLQSQVIAAIHLFEENRYDAVLHNHSLKGSMAGLSSFSVNNDYRIIYQETKNYFLFLDIGTHDEIYEK